MPKEIISEEETTLPRVKKLLSQRAKDGELSFQQNITLEHASAFSKMAPAAADKLVERLIKNFGITRAQAVQVVNIAPTTVEELRTILDARSTSITDEQILEIAEIVKKATS
ncbi:MAG: RNA polymerase Rpb4 family protein [Candidatus Thorarchaeota archaeon]